MHRRHKQVSVPHPSGSSTGRARSASGASAFLRGGRAPRADWDGLRRREPTAPPPAPRSAWALAASWGGRFRPSDLTTSAGTGAKGRGGGDAFGCGEKGRSRRLTRLWGRPPTPTISRGAATPRFGAEPRSGRRTRGRRHGGSEGGGGPDACQGPRSPRRVGSRRRPIRTEGDDERVRRDEPRGARGVPRQRRGRRHGGRRYFKGKPVLVLHTTGAKTGRGWETPLMYLDEGDDRFVFASKGGAPNHPDWYHNLKANPDVTVDVGTESYPATARVITGPERDGSTPPRWRPSPIRRLRAEDDPQDPGHRARPPPRARRATA